MLIISYVSNAGPACGSRFVGQVFAPPGQPLAARHFSRRRIHTAARDKTVSVFSIDIKKSGKTHLAKQAAWPLR